MVACLFPILCRFPRRQQKRAMRHGPTAP
jgi:hypothetical protein